jgi:uncharacterized cofD-like protein
MKQIKRTWHQTIAVWLRQSVRWLIPGIGVKRWLVLTLMGITLLGVGLAIFFLDFYRTAPETWWLPLLSAASLRFLARPLRVIIFGGAGIVMVIYGIWGMNRAILKPYIRPGEKPVLDKMAAYRRREKGPRVVVVGGGNGQATLLRGLKEYTHNLTAIVTVADDGGSSGELRRSMGILPPGDIRNCLSALSNDEDLLTQVFQYRFGSGSGLNGHSLGNLFISALAEITGSFEDAVAESGRVLAVHGRVLPSTLHDLRLVADVRLPQVASEVRVEGESRIPQMAGHVRRVWLEPENPPAYPPSVQAILNADMIVIGPGSLYTSILPNLLVPDLVEAIRSSRAFKVYVCNVATQKGETDGYKSGDHVRVLEEHVGGGLFDLIVCNKADGDFSQGFQYVKMDETLSDNYPVYAADLIDRDHPARHDSNKLAQILMDLYFEKTGPLSSKELE